MTASSKPGVEETLELVNRLKGTVQEFAARETELNQEFRMRAMRERQRMEESTAGRSQRLEEQRAGVETGYEQAKAGAEALYERRKAKIARARTLSKGQSLDRIEGRTGARKYELQKQLLRAERDRDAGLQNAAATCNQFKNDLAVENENLAALEKSAHGAFRGYGIFRRQLADAGKRTQSEQNTDATHLVDDVRKLLKEGGEDLGKFRFQPLPLLFRFLPPWLLLPLCVLPALPPMLAQWQIRTVPVSYSTAVGWVIAVMAAAAVMALHFIGKGMSAPGAARVAGALGKARRLVDTGFEMADIWYQQEVERINSEFTDSTGAIDQNLKQALKENWQMKGSFRETIDEKTVRITKRNEEFHAATLKRLENEHAEAAARAGAEIESYKAESARALETMESGLKAEEETKWKKMEGEWKSRTEAIFAAINEANAGAEKLFPPWSEKLVTEWAPPSSFAAAAKFGKLDVDVDKMCEGVPKDARLALPGPAKLSLPMQLTYPREGSILFEMANSAREAMMAALNNVILRLLANAPPGRLNFTVIDPVGLGQNFAGIMHLADYEAQIINSRIWTQTQQIEQKLADLNEHMEKVIQMYLRNEYETIAEYNEQAGNIAEKYHFLVVADFPVNFSETAVKRLLSIATSGARCGVYTLIHWDQRQPLPQEFVPKELRKSCVSLTARGNEVTLTGKFIPGTNLVLDTPPSAELATEFIQKLGEKSRDSSRVEVPFEHVAPPAGETWSLDTTNELRVPIGRTGATKLQYLAIGKGTRQHALVAGKTGSGKSTLFHVIITNLALWASPEQVEFYLIDFKKGVEFKCYAAQRLPHARVVAIESDREFGLSVLQRVDDELRRRGDLFRKLGAQDIAGYKRAGGTEAIPRSLLLIDEFQEFFVEDDKVSQTASVLLDRIVRQGRAFGIHVILGSQTLGGAYTLARTTIGQMVIRIALQCNEADAYLIMDENNPAPRLLSRPGEGIYNDTAGSVEGNSPFQVVWLPDEVRDHNLELVRQRADQSGREYGGPVVFEGNAPADVRENEVLKKLLATEAVTTPVVARIWLGAPNSIKGPTEAAFHRQSGNHLIVIGQREEAAMTMMAVALISLAAQYPKGKVKFAVFDGNPPGSPQREFMERVAKIIPHEMKMVKAGELAETMNGLAEELKKRMAGEDAEAPEVFLLFHGLQKIGKLRHEEDFSFSAEEGPADPGAQLNEIITEGASHGFHVLATFDTYNNVNRSLSRKALTEFEMRVLFQMSMNDSASLIDNPKASALGLHRALFYNEQEGYLETFRPYALPDEAWIEEAGKALNAKTEGREGAK
jgi:DNA segregation ATPase FtsK/SpoIIIE, S-DNA-T family